MQRGQRRAQVVGHAGHHLAVRGGLLLFPGGLRFDARGHGREGGFDGPHLVAAHRRRRRIALAVGVHAPRQPVQRPRQAPEGEDPQGRHHQKACAGHHRQAPGCAVRPRLRGHRFARRAVEHHVQVTGRAAVARARRKHCGAEDTPHAGAGRVHRVGAVQRQWRTGQEEAHRPQVDLRLLHHARFADVMRDAAVGVEHVDVHAGVDHHQHLQQRLACGQVLLGGVAPADARDHHLRPVAHDVPRQTVRQALQRLLLLPGRHLACHQQHAGAVDQQQHGQRRCQPRTERAAQRAPASKRYPTPQTVTMRRGSRGSSSILVRSRLMCELTVCS